MASEIKDGGPAFPVPLPDGEHWPGEGDPNGMSLRDWFAGQALPQAVEDYDRQTRGVMDTKMPVLQWATERSPRELIIAEQAYKYADAMLKARAAP